MERNFDVKRDVNSYEDILNLISETNLKNISCKRMFGFKISKEEKT